MGIKLIKYAQDAEHPTGQYEQGKTHALDLKYFVSVPERVT